MFNKYPDIPKASAKRMGLYYQYVKTLENNQIDRVSSKEISKDLRIEAATVRRDLSYFGALGKKGYGYSVESLMTFFEDLFSDTHSRLMAVVGMDLLGKSLLHYPSFSAANMSVSCAFDFTDNEVGRSFYHDIGEGANYYSYLSEELPAQVAYFLNRTIPAERTHVMGLSMGGFGALKWGLNQAEKFATVVSFSGAMYLDELWKNDSGRNTEFTRLFGKPENIPLSINDLEHAYCHAEKVNPQLVVRQYCGDLDFLYAYNRKLEAFAQSRSLDYRFSLGIGENHTWSYWDKSLEKTLGELFNK